jgi:hypothetical protein
MGRQLAQKDEDAILSSSASKRSHWQLCRQLQSSLCQKIFGVAVVVCQETLCSVLSRRKARGALNLGFAGKPVSAFLPGNLHSKLFYILANTF